MLDAASKPCRKLVVTKPTAVLELITRLTGNLPLQASRYDMILAVLEIPAGCTRSATHRNATLDTPQTPHHKTQHDEYATRAPNPELDDPKRIVYEDYYSSPTERVASAQRSNRPAEQHH